MISLSLNAKEESTYIIVCAFFDENGAPVVPASNVEWTLIAGDGNTVIGTGSESAGAEVSVVLSGEQLAISRGAKESRFFLVETSYNSNLGANLPLKEEASFIIENLKGFPHTT